MFTVVLVIDVILAVILVGLVLVQRSDGALGSIGGGASSMMSTRAKGNFLTKSTAIVAALFMACSVVLCIMTKADSAPKPSILATAPVATENTDSKPLSAPVPTANEETTASPAAPEIKAEPTAPVAPTTPAAPVSAD